MEPTVTFDFEVWMAGKRQKLERILEQLIERSDAPASLKEAMHYAVMGGGKRLRMLLVSAASEAVHGWQRAEVRAACAVEMIHAYSLIHDDLPCMDNDVLRRGKPTVHVQFGEAQALLAGDALQALAFEILSEKHPIDPLTQARLCYLLARAAGASGMAGGQAIDLASVGVQLTEDALRHMHRLKTGALLQASVMMGAHCARDLCIAANKHPDSERGQAREELLQRQHALRALERYGAAIGLAFQVVDDILDVTQSSATLGKTAGKDAADGKPTYVSLMGLDKARAYADSLLAEAHAALDDSDLKDTRALAALADMVVQRTQ